MERVNGEATSAVTTAAAAGPRAQYLPPAVAWEEEFSPVADSQCVPGDGSGCVPFRPPWEDQ
jgi:hypothetical protein